MTTTPVRYSFSKGLKMFKAEFNGLSRLGETRKQAFLELTKAYNALPAYQR